jgi:hypothetical protein
MNRQILAWRDIITAKIQATGWEIRDELEEAVRSAIDEWIGE